MCERYQIIIDGDSNMNVYKDVSDLFTFKALLNV